MIQTTIPRGATVRCFGLVALLTLLGACRNDPPPSVDSGTVPVDAGEPDAGPPPCTVGCNAVPDAGAPDAAKIVYEVKILKVTPKRAPVAGGTSVTVDGKGFYMGFAAGSTTAKKDTRIYFGKNEGSQFQIIDDDTLDVLAPPNPVGDVDLVIVNPNGRAVCQKCFSYFQELELNSLNPTVGPLEGGIDVELKGVGLSADTTVLFGGLASPRVTFVDDRTVKATVPTGKAGGPVDVRVFNKNGVKEIRRAFTYQLLLKVERVSPPYGPLGGGSKILVHGTEFDNVISVSLGAGNFGASVTKDRTTLEVTTPPGLAPGLTDVTVKTQTGSHTLKGGFVYYDDQATGLTVAGVAPNHGPSAGKNRLSVVGSGFTTGTVEVLFGQSRAVPLAVPTANVYEVEAPAGTANTDVDVTVKDGTNEAVAPKGYHYNISLAKVAPPVGPAKGGETVTLSGAGFSSALEVFFGALPASDLKVVDATTVTVKTPPGAGGPADVTVRDPADRANKDVLVGGYSYLEPFSIGRISPDSGAVAGGTFVTVMGTGFEPGVVVQVGNGRLRDIKIADRNTITGRTPPGTTGPADVAVAKGSAKDVLGGGFSYFDPKNAGGGASGGPLNGTLNVTVLDGTRGQQGQPINGALVMLGSDPTTPFQGKTDRRGQITFSDPQLVKAQQVTVSKEGYEAITVSRQESQNLTVYLSVNDGGEHGPPSFPPSPPPAIISGKVTGFKTPRALTQNEVTYAEVWIAPASLYHTAPLGQAPNPARRDASGERWRVTVDGGTYTIFSGKGLKAIYAVFGIFDKSTQVFTPYLMGIRRGVTADPDQPATNVNIVLDMHLDVQVPITIDNPLTDPQTGQAAINEVFAYLDLGGEGVIPMGKKSDTQTRFNFPGIPRLDGDSFIFLNNASAGGSIPESYFFRRQFGDLAKGVTIGPMLGMLDLKVPSSTNPRFTGDIRWTMGAGPQADMTYIVVGKLTMAGLVTLWSGIAPGSDRSISVPPNVVDAIRMKLTPKDKTIVQLITIRSPRFDYNHWSYGQLSLDAWTSFGFTGAQITFF